jgi:hypothetical protein
VVSGKLKLKLIKNSKKKQLAYFFWDFSLFVVLVVGTSLEVTGLRFFASASSVARFTTA